MDRMVRFENVKDDHLFYARDAWWRKTPGWRSSEGKHYNAVRVDNQSSAEAKSSASYFDRSTLVRYSSEHQSHARIPQHSNVISLSEIRAARKRSQIK